jgi:hypothetical protein
MQMLYDSDAFAVVHVLVDEAADTAELADASADPPAPHLLRHGFEIVDKRSGKGLYLDGSWAEMFQQQIQAWQRDTPTREEVETLLEGYATLAQNPILVQ